MITVLDHQSLLAAILAHPKDDMPRLALADLLQDEGDAVEQARGQFIHRQVSLWQDGWRDPLPMTPLFARDETGWITEAETLVRKHGRTWLADDLDGIYLPGIEGIPSLLRLSIGDHCAVDCSFVWLRGFPDRFTLSWQAWLIWGDRLKQTWPIGDVKLTGLIPSGHWQWMQGVEEGADFSMDDNLWVRVNVEVSTEPQDPLKKGQQVWLAARWPGVRFTFEGE